jgi:hypothetical protein
MILLTEAKNFLRKFRPHPIDLADLEILTSAELCQTYLDEIKRA